MAVTSNEKQSAGTLDLFDDEAFILVKAAPRRSETFGETVCCAGIDGQGQWVRLYPVSFRQLEDEQRFRRWDHVKYRWSRPKASKDTRQESRRVDPNSVEITGRLKPKDRSRLASRAVISSLKREYAEGRSLALLKPEIIDFWPTKQSDEELAKKQRLLENLRAQADMFAPKSLLPMRTCPYSFHYKYRDDDGVHEGTCQDWETEQTFFARLQDQASEQAALDWMIQTFGIDYPRKGMALAMGTHRYRLEQWLINGIIRFDEEAQQDLFF